MITMARSGGLHPRGCTRLPCTTTPTTTTWLSRVSVSVGVGEMREVVAGGVMRLVEGGRSHWSVVTLVSTALGYVGCDRAARGGSDKRQPRRCADLRRA